MDCWMNFDPSRLREQPGAYVDENDGLSVNSPGSETPSGQARMGFNGTQREGADRLLMMRPGRCLLNVSVRRIASKNHFRLT